MNMIDVDSIEYYEAETIDGKRIRIPIAYSYSTKCPVCEGTGMLSWVTCREWPTPHELPTFQAHWGGMITMRFKGNYKIRRPHPCRYCHGTGEQDANQER